jgi:uncharacterized protein (DUF58 family)
MARAEGRLHFGLTDAGKMLVRGVAYVGFAALMVPAFGALSVLLSVMLVALVVGFVVRPRVQVSGRLPDHIIAGQTAQLTYTLKNVGRLRAYNLSLRFFGLPDTVEQVEDARMVPRLGPGETAEVTVTMRPKRRGFYQVRQPVCQSNFPFNLFHFGTSRSGEETLIVLPAFSLMHLPLRYASRHVNSSGARLAGRTGTSPEYVGSRPFLSGDSPRRIDVRAWARLSVPATKEYDDDLDNYAALVLDTRVPEKWLKSKSKEIRELEAAVSLCASVAYTIYRDCLIDLLLAGPELHQFSDWPKTLRLDKIHETLARVEPSAEYQPEQIEPLLEERFQEVSEAVFILLRWDKTYRRLVELAERAGCQCTVIVVSEPLWSPAATGAGAGACDDVRFVSADEILEGRVEHL